MLTNEKLNYIGKNVANELYNLIDESRQKTPIEPYSPENFEIVNPENIGLPLLDCKLFDVFFIGFTMSHSIGDFSYSGFIINKKIKAELDKLNLSKIETIFYLVKNYIEKEEEKKLSFT